MKVCRSINEISNVSSINQQFTWSNVNCIDTLVYKVIALAQQIYIAAKTSYPEQYYEDLLYKYLLQAGLKTLKQVTFHPKYSQYNLETSFRCDLIVAQNLLIEIKANNSCKLANLAQLNIYQKLLGIKHGLLVNFAAPSFHQAIHRFYVSI